MSSPERVASNAVIYAGLLLGAVITLLPFGLGLLTSFTSAQQFVTESPLSLPGRRPWPITSAWPTPGSAARSRSRR